MLLHAWVLHSFYCYPSTEWVYYKWIMYSPADGHFSCFQTWVIMNKDNIMIIFLYWIAWPICCKSVVWLYFLYLFYSISYVFVLSLISHCPDIRDLQQVLKSGSFNALNLFFFFKLVLAILILLFFHIYCGIGF